MHGALVLVCVASARYNCHVILAAYFQVSGWDGAKSLHADHGHAIRYKGMVDCFVRTVKEEGMAALFKGIVPNYVKVRLAFGIQRLLGTDPSTAYMYGH